MEANQRSTRWTYAEFARLPTSGSTRHEVIDGELVVTPAPSSTHQRLVGELVLALGSFAKANELGRIYPGPIDVIFAEGDYMEPDLLFVRSDHAHVVTDRGVEGPPDLIVEVASPATAARDRTVKLDRYRHFGVGEYWIVDPERRTIEVWRLGAGVGGADVYGVGDELEWTPVAEGPTLRVDVGEVLGEE